MNMKLVGLAVALVQFSPRAVTTMMMLPLRPAGVATMPVQPEETAERLRAAAEIQPATAEIRPEPVERARAETKAATAETKAATVEVQGEKAGQLLPAGMRSTPLPAAGAAPLNTRRAW